jgi:PAS domain S-box-containing protein
MNSYFANGERCGENCESGADSPSASAPEDYMHDISLRAGADQFRPLADNAPVMIWISDAEALRTFFNKSWLEFTGHPPDHEIGEGWTKGVHPDDLMGCLENYKRSSVACAKFTKEYRLRHADGRYRWVLDHGIPLFEKGIFTGYIGICMDIGEPKETGREHTGNRQQSLSLIAQVTNDVIYEREIISGTAWWNEQAFNVLRYPNLV